MLDRLRQVHRLQVLQLGLPLRRARARRAPEGDEEVHAVRGPHLRPAARRARPHKPACVKACPTSARIFGDIHDPSSDASARSARTAATLMPEWGAARQPLPAAARRGCIHDDELVRDNPLRVEGHLLRPMRRRFEDASFRHYGRQMPAGTAVSQARIGARVGHPARISQRRARPFRAATSVARGAARR